MAIIFFISERLFTLACSRLFSVRLLSMAEVMNCSAQADRRTEKIQMRCLDIKGPTWDMFRDGLTSGVKNHWIMDNNLDVSITMEC